MSKNLPKKNGNPSFKKAPSKDELIDTMTKLFELQKEIATTKEKQYRNFEAEREADDKKTKNPYLNELNCQIDALIRTSTALIRINGSNLEAEEEATGNTKKKDLLD